MANSEMQLISRIVHVGDLASVLEWGITLEDFKTSEGRSLFGHVCSYFANSATVLSVMGPQLFKNMFPNVQLVADDSVATAALCYEVRKARVIYEAKEKAAELIDGIDIDPQLAVSEMHAHMTRLLSLGTRKNSDVTMSGALERIMTKYEIVKTMGPGAFAKMLWPWDVMNEATGGVQEDDYIVIYGRPKSMKTWVISYILASAFHQQKRTLIYTKEMTQDNIFMRASACAAQIPYQEFRSGKLDPNEEEAMRSLMEYARTSHFDPICLSGRDADGGDTVSWLHSKIEKYKPDVVFIDGMYLLKGMTKKNAATWERVTDISRALRDMILATKIPAVCSMQANRSAAKHSGGNLDELAYADAIGQDATVAIRCIAEKTSPTIALVMAGSREFKLHGIRIHAIPATDFTYKEKMDEKEIRKAEEGDTGEEQEDPNNHGRARKAAKAGPPPVRKSKHEQLVAEQGQKEVLQEQMEALT